MVELLLLLGQRKSSVWGVHAYVHNTLLLQILFRDLDLMIHFGVNIRYENSSKIVIIYFRTNKIWRGGSGNRFGEETTTVSILPRKQLFVQCLRIEHFQNRTRFFSFSGRVFVSFDPSITSIGISPRLFHVVKQLIRRHRHYTTLCCCCCCCCCCEILAVSGVKIFNHFL